jgi:hypothetical protein
MEWMCGPFQPDLLPDWLSKIGPAIAAFVAVGLFAMTRWYARRDLRAKRRVLRVMLIGHIRDALYYAHGLQNEFTSQNPAQAFGTAHFAKRGMYELPGTERLLDLQGELIGSADHGDEIVAEFIEKCRIFRGCIDELAKFSISDGSTTGASGIIYERLAVRTVMRAHAGVNDVHQTGQAAVAHLERLLPRIRVG